MRKLEGKVAIICGCGPGIGRGIALAFTKEGAKIVVAEIIPDRAKAVAEEIRQLGGEALVVVCDVGNEEQVKGMVEQAVKKFGAIDILVCVAIQAAPQGPLEEITEEAWDRTFQTGPKATWYCCKAVFPYMKDRGGKIINFGAGAGITGRIGVAAYSAAKAAIIGFSKTAAREWGKHKINVNVIVPSAASPGQIAFYEAHPEEAKRLAELTILYLGGDPERDIGRAAVFLASEDSDYITAHILTVDGGRTVL